MNEPAQKYTPAHVPSIMAVWVAVLLLLAHALGGCASPGQPMALLDRIHAAETLIDNGQVSLKRAIDLGLVDVTSSQYAKVYTGLANANKAIDAAKASYFAGDHENAKGMQAIGLETYQAIRPLLYDLAGVEQ